MRAKVNNDLIVPERVTRRKKPTNTVRGHSARELHQTEASHSIDEAHSSSAKSSMKPSIWRIPFRGGEPYTL